MAAGEAPLGPGDDYQIEAEQQEETTPVAARIIHVVQLVLFAVISVLTLAVFWIIGLMIGLL